jgi:hypothetical protein
MCKIESTHENADEYRAFVNGAFTDPRTMPWDGGFFVTGDQDPQTGRFVAVAYLAREVNRFRNSDEPSGVTLRTPPAYLHGLRYDDLHRAAARLTA